MSTRFRLIISSIIIFIISISGYYIIFLYPDQETEDWKEITIYNNENSIYNGYTQSELAEYFAIALNVTPLISKEMEPYHGIIWFKYYYQNNTRVIITLNDGKFWEPGGDSFKIRTEKYIGTNITDNPLRAGEIIFNIWNKFLGYLNFQLDENYYNLSVESHGTSSWKVIIRQICNNNISLINTGLVGVVKKENSRINTIWIDNWSIKRIQKPISISFENAKNIICNETLNFTIDKKLLNFTGYTYISDYIYYYFEYYYFLDYELNNYFHYNFYVDVENGVLEYNKDHIIKIESETKKINSEAV